MRKTKLEKEFAGHILWLQRYYRKSKNNPVNSILLDMLEEREKTAQTDKFSDNTCQLLFAWLEAITLMINKTDSSVMSVVKAVYVNRSMNMTGAGQRYLHYGQTKTIEIVRGWFEELTWQHVEAMNRIARSEQYCADRYTK